MIPFLATTSEIFTPVAAVAASLIATGFAFWMGAGKLVDRITTTVKASLSLDAARTRDNHIPQPLDVHMATAPIEAASFDHHCLRNREAHTRFRTELDGQDARIASLRTEIAVLEERSKNNALMLAKMEEHVGTISTALARMCGKLGIKV